MLRQLYITWPADISAQYIINGLSLTTNSNDIYLEKHLRHGVFIAVTEFTHESIYELLTHFLSKKVISPGCMKNIRP